MKKVKNITPIDILLTEYNNIYTQLSNPTLKASNNNEYIIQKLIPNTDNLSFTTSRKIKYDEKRSFMSQKYFNAISQYLYLFHEKIFHFLLFDYSLIRFNYEFNNENKLVSFNLSWTPCPFNEYFFNKMIQEQQPLFSNFGFPKFGLGLQALSEIELDNDIFESRGISLRSPLRLDFDSTYENDNFAYHPTYHFHIETSDTRLFASRPVTIHEFMLLVFEMCYPQQMRSWNEYQDISKNIPDVNSILRPMDSANDNDFGNKLHIHISLHEY